jgi:hypothetical protein
MLRCLKEILKYGLITLVTLLAIEVIGNLFFLNNNYFWNHRYLFITKGAYRHIDSGLFTYQPNMEVDSVAVYGLPSSDYFWLEYKCKFKTNEIGLISTGEPKSGKPTILVLGDSFTEGHGGCPWLTQVRKPQFKANYINGGLQGTGIEQFKNLYDYVKRQGVQFEKVIIVAISNDFFRRPHANWIQYRWKCLEELRCGRKDLWWGSTNFNEEDLIQISKERATRRYFGWSIGRQLDFVIQKFSITNKFIGLILTAMSGEKTKVPAIPASNQRALQYFYDTYVNFQLILVPQRDEVGLAGPNIETLTVRKYLEQNNLAYSECPLGGSDYMRFDGHPNATGYDKVFECLQQAAAKY